MAEKFMRYKAPTVSFGGTAMEDPRSFAITPVVDAISSGGRPGDAFMSTIEVFRHSFRWSFTIGDEVRAHTLGNSMSAGTTEKDLVGVTQAPSHGTDLAITYTLADCTVTGFPGLGSGFQEGRTFSFSGIARANTPSTSPLVMS